MLSIPSTVEDGTTRVWMAGVCLDALSETQLIDQVIASSLVGRGGWIATPNINFLRRIDTDAELQSLLAGATLRVADGMPLLWASWLARAPRLQRVPGSQLVFSLATAAARHQRSVYLIGGSQGASSEAGVRLQGMAPGLRVVGAEEPWMSAAVTAEEIEPVIQRLEAARPDIVFVGLGFPKQERFIAACRDRLPGTWFLGCGQAVNFAAGVESRAPRWMQRSGLEWMHRLLSEPRRLGRRYAADIPFALRVLIVSAISGGMARNRPADVTPYPHEVVVIPDRRKPIEDTIPVTSAPIVAQRTPDLVIDLRDPATLKADAV